MVLCFAKALNSLAVSGGGCVNMLADACRADEGDTLNVGVGQEDVRFNTAAGNKVDNTLRKSGFDKKLAKTHSGHRRHGSKL